MRFFVLGLAVLVGLSVVDWSFGQVTWADAGTDVVAPLEPVPEAVTPTPAEPTEEMDAAAAKVAKARDRFFSRNWRRLGLTARNGAKILRELRDNGECDKSEPARTKAAAIAGVLVQDNPEPFVTAATSPEFGDWGDFFDALVTFIEKLIPLIELIMSLFK